MNDQKTEAPTDGAPTGLALATGSASELRISGYTARIIIVNCHALLRHKFRRTPLWSMVSQITGHGSGYSWEICKSANLDGGQNCGVERLKDFPPNVQSEPRHE